MEADTVCPMCKNNELCPDCHVRVNSSYKHMVTKCNVCSKDTVTWENETSTVRCWECLDQNKRKRRGFSPEKKSKLPPPEKKSRLPCARCSDDTLTWKVGSERLCWICYRKQTAPSVTRCEVCLTALTEEEIQNHGTFCQKCHQVISSSQEVQPEKEEEDLAKQIVDNYAWALEQKELVAKLNETLDLLESDSEEEFDSDDDQKKVSDQVCVSCKEREPQILFEPCGHFILCRKCIDNAPYKIHSCPSCQADIVEWHGLL